MLLNCGVGEDSWESLGLQGEQTSQCLRKSVLNIQWKDWCWSWNSNSLATWCKEPTHWKRPWSWERLKAGGEGGDRGWDGWMASLTQWTWVWANSSWWWRTGKPGVLQSMGSQRVRQNWKTELNWTIILSPFQGYSRIKRKTFGPTVGVNRTEITKNPGDLPIFKKIIFYGFIQAGWTKWYLERVFRHFELWAQWKRFIIISLNAW